MNDLEICKRIAEIEGIHVSNADVGMYDPLINKALCFDLMVKHNIELTPLKGGDFLATPIKKYDVYGAPDMCLNKGYVDYNPQRAICLAIIEANKEQ